MSQIAASIGFVMPNPEKKKTDRKKAQSVVNEILQAI